MGALFDAEGEIALLWSQLRGSRIQTTPGGLRLYFFLVKGRFLALRKIWAQMFAHFSITREASTQ